SGRRRPASRSWRSSRTSVSATCPLSCSPTWPSEAEEHVSPHLPLKALIAEDLATARRRDPAARTAVEVALTYPGVHALWLYRLAHHMWRLPLLRLPARVLSQLARAATGGEIHPGAVLGRRFFVDHGTGVLIGESAEVGDGVMMFHGQT